MIQLKSTVAATMLTLVLSAALQASAQRPTDIPRDTSFTVWSTAKKVHKKHPEAVVMPASLPAGVKEWRDVVYTHFEETPFGPRDLHVDIFRPDNDSILPALLMVHGGGWNSGDRSLQFPMAQQIAKAGYVTIPVEYRLIPEAIYPAGLHDLKTAVRWARAHAAEYGIDPERIAMSGCSAGAHLATLVGVTNGSPTHEGNGEWADCSSELQAVINMDGIATFVSPENILDSEQHFKKKGELHVNAKWLGGLYKDSPAHWNEASALNWITPSSAPVCFISSGLPRYSDGRDELVERYNTLGLYSERHKIDVDIHPYWFFHPWVDEALTHAVRFLDKTFKTQSSNTK